jgi:hypothetical protein
VTVEENGTCEYELYASVFEPLDRPSFVSCDTLMRSSCAMTVTHEFQSSSSLLALPSQGNTLDLAPRHRSRYETLRRPKHA